MCVCVCVCVCVCARAACMCSKTGPGVAPRVVRGYLLTLLDPCASKTGPGVGAQGREGLHNTTGMALRLWCLSHGSGVARPSECIGPSHTKDSGG